MSKLFAVTGQNNRRNAGKRAVDTEILLREAQSRPRDSDRYATAVARMNYLYVYGQNAVSDVLTPHATFTTHSLTHALHTL